MIHRLDWIFKVLLNSYNVTVTFGVLGNGKCGTNELSNTNLKKAINQSICLILIILNKIRLIQRYVGYMSKNSQNLVQNIDSYRGCFETKFLI